MIILKKINKFKFLFGMNRFKTHKKLSKGFSLAELLIVIVILGLIASIVVSSFGQSGGSEALNTSTISAISVLNTAKSMAISSKDASKYGVRIFNNKFVTFKNSYGTENQETVFSTLISVSTSTGIGTDIIFNNVSGGTSASGTVTFTILNNPSKSNTIRVYPTGIIEKN